MSPNAIEINALSKNYGDTNAISNITLNVNEGEVFGYLGPNGAGKTTTIRILVDLIRATSGRASIFGLDTRDGIEEVRSKIGYLPSDIALYENLTGMELLKYLSNLRKIVEWDYVSNLADRLECDLSLRISTLSRGNKQKIGLIQSLMHHPELVIMDEPSSGLDPLMQQEFYRLVEEIKSEGRTILISSHIIPEIERLCDRVGIIRDGILLTVEEIDSLKQKSVHQIEFHFTQPAAEDALNKIPGISEVTVDGNSVKCTIIGSPDKLIKAAAKFEITKLISHEPNLEEVFLSYYGKVNPDAQ